MISFTSKKKLIKDFYSVFGKTVGKKKLIETLSNSYFLKEYIDNLNLSLQYEIDFDIEYNYGIQVPYIELEYEKIKNELWQLIN